MSTAQRVAIGVVVLSVVAFGWSAVSGGRRSEPTGSYCITFGSIDDDLAAMDRVLSGRARPDDESIDTLRGVVGLVWSDSVALGGPTETDADAVEVATAVRAAVKADDPAPIRTPEVRAAARRLTPKAAAACEGSGV